MSGTRIRIRITHPPSSMFLVHLSDRPRSPIRCSVRGSSKDDLLADGVRVPYNTKMSFRPRHGDVESPLLTQETDFMLGIAAHCAHNHGLLLAALEPIHRTKLKVGVPLFEQT